MYTMVLGYYRLKVECPKKTNEQEIHVFFYNMGFELGLIIEKITIETNWGKEVKLLGSNIIYRLINC
jgi:hypothetical protein